MRRGEVYWATLPPPSGRRPVLVLTRTRAIPLLHKVVVAEMTRTIRDIPSEVRLGVDEGLPEDCVANCDNLATIAQALLDPEPLGCLDAEDQRALDRALRFSLEIRS